MEIKKPKEINESLAKKWLLDIFRNIYICTKDKFNPKQYFVYKKKILMVHEKNSLDFTIDSNEVYNILQHKFKLNNQQITNLLRDTIFDYYGISIRDLYTGTLNNSSFKLRKEPIISKLKNRIRKHIGLFKIKLKKIRWRLQFKKKRVKDPINILRCETCDAASECHQWGCPCGKKQNLKRRWISKLLKTKLYQDEQNKFNRNRTGRKQ